MLGWGMTVVRLSKDLAEEGYTYAEMARMTRTEELVRVRRGAYAVPADGPLSTRATHVRLLAATVGQASTELVVSHMSAAALHGLPIWNDSLERVHLTRNRQGQGKVRRYVHLHCTPLPDHDVVEIDGFRVTSLARTVVDLASSLDALHAVPIGDAALRNGLRPDQLAQLADESGGRRGIAGARRSLALLDARSESPGESMSRVVLHQHRVPPPELQLEVFAAHGTLVGRTDFGWREQRTLGEFDGRSKYGRLLLRPGQTPEQALFEEKRREDALRDLGWEVVRWIWADLFAPSALLDRLARAFARGSGRS